MKKTLSLAIASATAIAATAATAQTVYDDDGLTLDLTGEVDVQYRQVTTDDTDPEMRLDDAQIAFKPSYTDGSGVTAFSYMRLDAKNRYNGYKEKFDADDTEEDKPYVDLEKAYVGVGFDNATVTVGRQTYASDEFGIGQDIEFGVNQAVLDTDGDNVVRAEYSMDTVTIIGSYDLEVQDDESSFDLFAALDASDSITVTGFAQAQKADADADTYFALGANIQYSMDALTVAGEVTYTNFEGVVSTALGDATIDGASAFQVSGAYDLSEKLTVAGGFGMQFLDLDDFDDPIQMYTNLAYDVVGNSKVYAELQYDYLDDDASDTQLGYAVGMKVKF